MSQRFAAIDIGTVTCRMLVADVEDGRIVELAKEYAITNLGEGVDATGVLKPEAMQRVGETISRYLQVRDSLAEGGEVSTVAMATSASRDAKNSVDFVAMLRDLGVELSVIPGEKEAELSFKGASGDFPGEGILVVDIGGGSTEVITGAAGQAPVKAHSFNIGCRRVTERFLHANPPSEEELRAASDWVREEMRWYFDELAESGFVVDRLVAVAGTATSVVSMRESMEVYDSERVHKAVVALEELEKITRDLANMTLEQRECVVGLDPKRAPVIVAGLLILSEILKLAGVSSFTASESDILQGIILDSAK